LTLTAFPLTLKCICYNVIAIGNPLWRPDRDNATRTRPVPTDFHERQGIGPIGTVYVAQAAAPAFARFVVGPWIARTSPRLVVSVNLVALGIALDFGIGAGAAVWGLLSDFIEMRWIFLLAGSLMIIALSAVAYMDSSRRTYAG